MASTLTQNDSDAQRVEAISQLPANLALMKLENDNIQSLAAARPRNHKLIRQEIADQLEAYPTFAEASIYSKPVGRDKDGVMKYARGLSIRAAEAIAEAYGYNRVRTDVTPIDENTVKVEATFTDYQKGRIWQDGGIVSKFFTTKYGKTQRIPDDRFYNVVVKAEMSRRVREVILRSVPPGLRSELQEMAERMLAKVLSGDGVQKIIEAFAKLSVTLEELENFIGRTIGQGWTEQDRVTLLGLYNAIESGESTKAEVFGEPVPDNGKQQTQQPSGPVTAEALTGQPSQESPPQKADNGVAAEPAPVEADAGAEAVAATPNPSSASYEDVMLTIDASKSPEELQEATTWAKEQGLTDGQKRAIGRKIAAKEREFAAPVGSEG